MSKCKVRKGVKVFRIDEMDKTPFTGRIWKLEPCRNLHDWRFRRVNRICPVPSLPCKHAGSKASNLKLQKRYKLGKVHHLWQGLGKPTNEGTSFVASTPSTPRAHDVVSAFSPCAWVRGCATDVCWALRRPLQPHIGLWLAVYVRLSMDRTKK